MSFILLLFEFLHFLITICLLFYLPGRILLSLRKEKLTFLSTIVLSFVIGAVVYTLLMYGLSWLQLQFLIYPFIALCIVVAWKKQLLSFPPLPHNFRKPVVLTAVASLFFSLPMVVNGNIGNSIYFFGDDIAHLAYINELRFTFPPEHPGFADVPLRGYHFFYDFLIAQLSNTAFLSHLSLYFHFMPLFVAFGWGFATLTLLYEWTKKMSTALFGVFFVLFGSSFGYLLYFFSKSDKLSTNFGIDQPYSALWNAPYAFSVVLVLIGLLLIRMYLQSRSVYILYLLSVVVGITPMFKVYAGILLIAGFGMLCLHELYKKHLHIIPAGFVAFLIFLSTYGIFSGEGAGIFYYPFWPVERVFISMFPEYGFDEKIKTYSEQGVIRGLVETYTYTLSVFIFGNLGTRIFGLLLLVVMFIKTMKKPSLFAIIVSIMLITSIVFPLFFAQTIKVFDMIQMTWYFPLFASLFAAIGISFFFSQRFSNVLKHILFILLLLLTLPLTIYSFFYETIPLMMVKRISYTGDSFKGMNYLRSQGTYQDTVLEVPLGKDYVHYDSLKSWYKSSSARIAALGEKRMYVGNQFITFPNMPLDERLQLLEQVNRTEYTDQLNTPLIPHIVQKLHEENISFIYTRKPLMKLSTSEEIQLVYNNPHVYIYKINY